MKKKSINFFKLYLQIRIDDRLPVRGNRPAYLHCAQHDVFWVALLEKAYAKYVNVTLSHRRLQ